MGRTLSETILINLTFRRRAFRYEVVLPVHAFSTELFENLDGNPFTEAIREESATADTGIAPAIFDF